MRAHSFSLFSQLISFIVLIEILTKSSAESLVEVPASKVLFNVLDEVLAEILNKVLDETKYNLNLSFFVLLMRVIAYLF